jgi:hypothetical protein
VVESTVLHAGVLCACGGGGGRVWEDLLSLDVIGVGDCSYLQTSPAAE